MIDVILDDVFKYFLQMMQHRISQMENQQVDYLRFDRIKIQRKRMEHILQVIKDLSFKNKQLFKENAALKEQRLYEGHYQKLYHQLTAERAILVQKNIQITSQLQKYKSTILQQEKIINSLKKQFHEENISLYKTYFSQGRQTPSQDIHKNYIRQYQILKAQYDDLKEQFSKIYQPQPHYTDHHLCYACEAMGNQFTPYSKENNPNATLTIKQNSQKIIKSNKNLEASKLDDALLKLREKYDKCKVAKKQLAHEVKRLQEILVQYEKRQQCHIDLIQVLKEKKTKMCTCHINKLKRDLLQTGVNISIINPKLT